MLVKIINFAFFLIIDDLIESASPARQSSTIFIFWGDDDVNMLSKNID